MNLQQLREKFVELSGRHDLVDENSQDAGADFFINAGQRFLDRRVEHSMTSGSVFVNLAVGGWYVEFKLARSVSEVYVNNTTGRTKLKFKSLSKLRQLYSSSIAETSVGAPIYYAPSIIRPVAGFDVKNSLGAFFTHVKSTFKDYDGLTILPATEEALVVEVVGKFYTDKLVSDEDETYWSVNHEDLLVWAALYKLEVSMRNTEGAKDWLNAIGPELVDIEKDLVENQLQDKLRAEDE